MDRQPPAPGGQQPGQVQDLFLGFGGGVGVAEEMHHLQRQPALGHHPGGHGAVDAAGEQGDGVPPHAHRQTPRAGGGVGVDVGGKIPHLHVDDQVRGVHVCHDMGKGLVQLSAHELGELDGGQGEGFVGALGLDLEALGGHEVVVEVGLGRLQNGLRGLLAGLGAGKAHHAEETGQRLEGPVHVAVLGLRLDIGDGLAGVDAELAELFQAPPGVAHEPLLKGPAVEALEDHLAHF